MHIATHEPTGELIGIDKADKGKNCRCYCVSCKGVKFIQTVYFLRIDMAND